MVYVWWMIWLKGICSRTVLGVLRTMDRLKVLGPKLEHMGHSNWHGPSSLQAIPEAQLWPRLWIVCLKGDRDGIFETQSSYQLQNFIF